jgi:hypothetical protein
VVTEHEMWPRIVEDERGVGEIRDRGAMVTSATRSREQPLPV